MATKKITDLVELISAASGDVLPIVDISDDITKKIQVNNLLASKQDTLVSGTNIKTLNSESLLGSGNIAISATPSGVSGAIQFSNGSAFSSDATNFFWDNTNKRLGIGTNAPTSRMQIVTDNATNPQAFSNQTSVLAGTASQGALISAFSSTNGGFINALWPGNAWFKMNYGGTNHNFSVAGVVTAVIDSNTTFGNGTTSLGARVGIKGGGSTSATTSLLVQNSAGTNALQVRDDLRVIVPSVFETGETNGFTFNSNVITTKINGFLTLDRTANREFRIADTSFSRNYLILQTSSSSNFADISFNTDHLAIKKEGNIGIGTASPTATTHIKGSGTTLATTALLVQNSAGTEVLKVQDDSEVKVRSTFRVQDAGGNNGMIMYADGISGIRTLWVNGSVGVGVLGNNASARLQVDSTTQGFLPPRMTTTQKNAIATPASGLMVYDKTDLFQVKSPPFYLHH
jgi:uncharacterized protein YxjI